MSAPVIRSLVSEDKSAWLTLWQGYQAFYERTVPSEVTNATWARLAQAVDIFGFLAVAEGGEGVGLVHYLFHPSTSLLGSSCYLPDLFVAPAARGHGVGRELIRRVAEAAKARGASLLYWQTEEFNGTARRLYERVAKRSPFIRYQLEL